MFSITEENNKMKYGITKFTADTDMDITNLPTTVYPGSTCMVVSTSNVYMLNNQHQWKKIITGGLSSGGGSTGGTVNAIKDIHLQGETLIFEFDDGSIIPVDIPLPKDGITPTIDPTTKHWMIDGKDTGVIAEGKNGIDGQDGADGVDGKDGKDGADGAPGPKGDKGDKGEQGPQGLKGDKGDQGDPGKNGVDGQDGADGISVTNIQIDSSNNLICILSDGSTINAGKLPNINEGGLLQVDSLTNLPQEGSEDVLYYIKDTEEMYVWIDVNKTYKQAPKIENSGVNQFFSILSLDGISSTYNAPVDDIDLNIYFNGVYLTEGTDYNIDRTQKPNKITFNEILEQTDLCTIVWLESGNGSGNKPSNINFATKDDIDKMFTNIDLDGDGSFELSFAIEQDIDRLFSEDKK